MMFEEYPDILTVMDVARALGIGKNSAYELIHNNSINVIRVGRKLLVPKICLIDYVLSARNNMDACNSRQYVLSERSIQ